MLSDGLYANVHTDVNPGGEVRGQLTTVALPNQTYVDELDNMLHDGSSNPNPVPGDPFGETTLGSNPLLSYTGPFNDYDGTVTLARRSQPSLEVPGITYSGRSIFASFGLEGMSETFNDSYGITPTSRAGLLGAFVVWLNTEPGTATITPTLVATTTLYNFGYAFTSNPQNPVATSPVQVRWDFGDGTPYVVAGNANTASHQYVCAADNVHNRLIDHGKVSSPPHRIGRAGRKAEHRERGSALRFGDRPVVLRDKKRRGDAEPSDGMTKSANHIVREIDERGVEESRILALEQADAAQMVGARDANARHLLLEDLRNLILVARIKRGKHRGDRHGANAGRADLLRRSSRRGNVERHETPSIVVMTAFKKPCAAAHQRGEILWPVAERR